MFVNVHQQLCFPGPVGGVMYKGRVDRPVLLVREQVHYALYVPRKENKTREDNV